MPPELEFTMDVQAADAERRTIEGTIVPYREPARIAGVAYSFEPGSIVQARARTPLLIDHDRGRPIGVLAELVDEPGRAFARFRGDRTGAGDEALTQAASGSRGSFSIGAELVEASEPDAAGVVHVRAASVREVSLLTLGAFPSASVERVTAADTPPDDPPDDPPPDDDPPPAPNPDQEEIPMDTDTVTAAADPPVLLTARARAPRELTATEYIQAMLQARQGDRAAIELLAALTETVSTDIPGLLPPTYETTVIGPSPVDRTLYDVFRGKPIPSVGLTIQKPAWTTFPNGAWAASVDADITTSAAVIGLTAATIERWDWGTALPYTVVKRSSPDAIDTIYAGAVENFYIDVEIKIATLLDTTAGTPNAAVKLGAAIGAFYTRCGRAPEVILVAPDVWGLLADAGALAAPNAAGGVATGDGLRSSFAGIPAVASAALAAGTKYLATRRALDVRITEPVQLTANAIGALNVELGVVGEGLFDADVPLEVMELTAGAPVELLAAAPRAK
jgi:phage head maturation protease